MIACQGQAGYAATPAVENLCQMNGGALHAQNVTWQNAFGLFGCSDTGVVFAAGYRAGAPPRCDLRCGGYRQLTAPIDRELARLISGSRNLVSPGDGCQMWYQSPVLGRFAAEAFFGAHGRVAAVTRK